MVFMSALACSSCFNIWIRFPRSSSILVSLSSMLLMSCIWEIFSQTSVATKLLNCSKVCEPGLSLKLKYDYYYFFFNFCYLICEASGGPLLVLFRGDDSGEEMVPLVLF
jgi:hypothetical protein